MIPKELDLAEIKVLVVEDEPVIANSIATSLKRMRYHISALAFDGATALEELQNNPPDIILLDINLESELDGIALAHRINTEFKLPFHIDIIRMEQIFYLQHNIEIQCGYSQLCKHD